MVKVYLISYADGKFKKQQDRLNDSAKKFGINYFISYNREYLKSLNFYKKYKHILDQSKGSGYWLWKPFFIYKTLSTIAEGDYLIYADAGAVFVNSPLPLLKRAKGEDIVLFSNGEENRKWNKRDCMIRMGCNDYKAAFAHQVTAGFQIYKNTKKSREFVKEWLRYCCKPGLIEDSLNKEKEDKMFKEHRHDQAILTNVAIKHNIYLYRDPSQGGNHLKPKEFRVRGEWLKPPYVYIDKTERFKYPTIINHLRDASKFRLLLIKIHSRLPRWLKKITKK